MIDISKAREKAKDLLKNGLPESLTYHSFQHTLWVVESCMVIASNEGVIQPYELEILETAAWFHDCGYTRAFLNHEQESCEIVKEILPSIGADADEIEKICQLIMATKIPQTPDSKLAAILCDADLDHLGRSDFPEWSEKLKKEWYALGIIKDEQMFYERQLQFLIKHRYHTKDAQERREPVKKIFLEQLSGNPDKRLTP